MENHLELLILAIIQGLTEFLPVSSSGHLEAWKRVSGSSLQGNLTVDVLFHFATLLSVCVVFRREFVRLLSGFWRAGKDRRDLLLVGLGAIPAGIVGLLLEDSIEGLSRRFPYLLPICWFFCGLAFLFQHRASGSGVEQPLKRIGVGAALWIGCWQAVALLPGVSRSGITILAALFIGVSREDSARYSFMIAAPLIIGATMLKIRKLLESDHFGDFMSVSLGVGLLTSFIVGLIALRLLLHMLKAGKLYLWGYYLISIAICLSVWTALRGGT